MAVKFDQNKLVIATHNAGKAREIRDLLAPYDLEILTAADLGLDEPEENGLTFAENAAIKSQAAALASGLYALADDSGLSVDALDGAPGIYSARWAGPGKDFRKAMQLVHEKMGDTENKDAHFTCVLSLSDPKGLTVEFEGIARGHVTWPPRGDKGFGYDPVFIPEGHERTFGEMEESEKDRISHRSHAFRKFVTHCF